MSLNIMTELKEGKMTIKDLSIWFGLKPETLAKSRPESREKKFKILEAYAEYHFEGKALYIDKVTHKIKKYTGNYSTFLKKLEQEKAINERLVINTAYGNKTVERITTNGTEKKLSFKNTNK